MKTHVFVHRAFRLKIASGRLQGASRRLQHSPRKLQESPKTGPGWFENTARRRKIAPRGLQDGPKTSPKVPKMVQPSPFERARRNHRAQDGPETPDAPTTGPLGAPPGPQEAPKKPPN